MDRSKLPVAPAGLCWMAAGNGLPMLYGIYRLPDGRRLMRNTGSNLPYTARRRYCAMQKSITEAWASGALDALLRPRATRSDKGKKRAKPRTRPVKQLEKSETKD